MKARVCHAVWPGEFDLTQISDHGDTPRLWPFEMGGPPPHLNGDIQTVFAQMGGGGDRPWFKKMGSDHTFQMGPIGGSNHPFQMGHGDPFEMGDPTPLLDPFEMGVPTPPIRWGDHCIQL